MRARTSEAMGARDGEGAPEGEGEGVTVPDGLLPARGGAEQPARTTVDSPPMRKPRRDIGDGAIASPPVVRRRPGCRGRRHLAICLLYGTAVYVSVSVGRYDVLVASRDQIRRLSVPAVLDMRIVIV